MKTKRKLPDQIINLFKLVEALQPNGSAALRPALTNALLISRHPASCRAGNTNSNRKLSA